jgi:hypothetical protein
MTERRCWPLGHATLIRHPVPITGFVFDVDAGAIAAIGADMPSCFASALTGTFSASAAGCGKL